MLRCRELFVTNKFMLWMGKDVDALPFGVWVWSNIVFVSLPLWHCVIWFSRLKLQMPKSFKWIPTSKIKRKKIENDKKKQHKKWTIAHQMCTHYYLIGGTSNPTNKGIIIDSHTKDASKNEKEKLVNENFKGLAFPKPLIFELSFLVITNHASI